MAHGGSCGGSLGLWFAGFVRSAVWGFVGFRGFGRRGFEGHGFGGRGFGDRGSWVQGHILGGCGVMSLGGSKGLRFAGFVQFAGVHGVGRGRGSRRRARG